MACRSQGLALTLPSHQQVLGMTSDTNGSARVHLCQRFTVQTSFPQLGNRDRVAPQGRFGGVVTLSHSVLMIRSGSRVVGSTDSKADASEGSG